MIISQKSSTNGACRISVYHRSIVAIGKHVIAEEALAGGDEGVGVEEAADGGVVITAL